METLCIAVGKAASKSTHRSGQNEYKNDIKKSNPQSSKVFPNKTTALTHIELPIFTDTHLDLPTLSTKLTITTKLNKYIYKSINVGMGA